MRDSCTRARESRGVRAEMWAGTCARRPLHRLVVRAGSSATPTSGSTPPRPPSATVHGETLPAARCVSCPIAEAPEGSTRLARTSHPIHAALCPSRRSLPLTREWAQLTGCLLLSAAPLSVLPSHHNTHPRAQHSTTLARRLPRLTRLWRPHSPSSTASSALRFLSTSTTMSPAPKPTLERSPSSLDRVPLCWGHRGVRSLPSPPRPAPRYRLATTPNPPR